MLTALRDRLDTLLSLSDDPQERIRALVADLRTRQAAGRRALGITVVLEKKLLDELISAEDAARACEQESRDALARADDAQASAHAQRLLGLQKHEKEARQRWEEQRALADKVRTAFREATKRTEEVAQAHTLLLARAHCAEAAKAISDALATLESPEIRRQLGRAEGRVEASEAATSSAAR